MCGTGWQELGIFLQLLEGEGGVRSEDYKLAWLWLAEEAIPPPDSLFFMQSGVCWLTGAH